MELVCRENKHAQSGLPHRSKPILSNLDNDIEGIIILVIKIIIINTGRYSVIRTSSQKLKNDSSADSSPFTASQTHMMSAVDCLLDLCNVFYYLDSVRTQLFGFRDLI